jgi:hypothetical protein|tara:strand:- start:109 stop:384 length:276 start_codon:yes stop_codon:yes gene_type:complete
MDNINMTDKQLRQLIDGLADSLVKRIYGVANDVKDPRETRIWHCDREDDEVVGELARLMTLLNLYQDREEYEKCHLVNKHIKRLEKIVENL